MKTHQCIAWGIYTPHCSCIIREVPTSIISSKFCIFWIMSSSSGFSCTQKHFDDRLKPYSQFPSPHLGGYNFASIIERFCFLLSFPICFIVLLQLSVRHFPHNLSCISSFSGQAQSTPFFATKKFHIYILLREIDFRNQSQTQGKTFRGYIQIGGAMLSHFQPKKRSWVESYDSGSRGHPVCVDFLVVMAGSLPHKRNFWSEIIFEIIFPFSIA